MSLRDGMTGALVGAVSMLSYRPDWSEMMPINRKIEPGYGGSWPVVMPKSPPRVKKPRGQKRRRR